MKKSQMLAIHRILLIVSGIALLLVNHFPIWRIQLSAPQYPEGLELLIYSDKLAGNVDIINGLNHYIGMKTLHTSDFAEFTVLPSLIIFFALLFIGTAIWGKRAGGYAALALFALFGIAAMVDFWKWEYDYGHNLSPDAAIIVPGMSYQPPLIGFKQLLNFGAYSIPAAGGWIFILTGIAVAGCMLREWLAGRSAGRMTGQRRLVLTLLFVAAGLAGMQSCGPSGAQPIQRGTDACAHCKMTISDLRFSCEMISQKGRSYKFDDVKCMISFTTEGEIDQADAGAFYVADFKTEALMPVTEVSLLHSEQLRSPMGGNCAGFKDATELAQAQNQFQGTVIAWDVLTK
ncbi:MAG TPA: nitrous oxide reductase accessory protein NosL [Dyadobacter sp.]|nr:nitrous oxide reductase accessory protein NosL [Dyadobacter sp.]